MFKKLLPAAGIFFSCFLMTPCTAMEEMEEECGKFWDCYARAINNKNYFELKTFGNSFFNNNGSGCIFTYFVKRYGPLPNALAYMVFRKGAQAKLVKTPDEIRNQFPQILKKVQAECTKLIKENSFDLEIYHVMPDDSVNFGLRFWSWTLFSSIENGKALKEYAEFEANFRELIKKWDLFLKSDEYKQIKDANRLSEKQKIKWVSTQVTKVLQILDGKNSYKDSSLAYNVFSLICMLSTNDCTIVKAIGENMGDYDHVFNNIKMFGDVACQHRKFDEKKENEEI